MTEYTNINEANARISELEFELHATARVRPNGDIDLWPLHLANGACVEIKFEGDAFLCIWKDHIRVSDGDPEADSKGIRMDFKNHGPVLKTLYDALSIVFSDDDDAN